MNLTLFDLDGTLIPGDSDHAFCAFLAGLGWTDGAAWHARNDAFYADYQRGTLDLPAYVAFATAPWRARPLAEAQAARTRFMHEVIAPMIRPEALALVRRHQAAGDRVAIVTATNRFVTEPIAQAFGVDQLLAVELACGENGEFTGAITGVPTFREGKVTRVDDWLAQQGLSWGDFDQTWFYSDSVNDLPLLERASHPVAVQPGTALRAVAQARGWPILNLFDQA